MATIETECHTGRHARGWAVVEEAAALLPGGELPAAIFNDEDIYAIESERIFARSWVYLAHESGIPDPGDYVLRYIGRSPFVVARDEDGDVTPCSTSAGTRGCRCAAPRPGNASHFRCPYHGWTYADDGRLIGIPAKRDAYGGAVDSPKGLEVIGPRSAGWSTRTGSSSGRTSAATPTTRS